MNGNRGTYIPRHLSYTLFGTQHICLRFLFLAHHHHQDAYIVGNSLTHSLVVCLHGKKKKKIQAPNLPQQHPLVILFTYRCTKIPSYISGL